MAKLADIRRRPAHTVQATLVAVDDGSERVVARYRFNHRPWAGSS